LPLHVFSDFVSVFAAALFPPLLAVLAPPLLAVLVPPLLAVLAPPLLAVVLVPESLCAAFLYPSDL
jgi:hypothetical protein